MKKISPEVKQRRTLAVATALSGGLILLETHIRYGFTVDAFCLCFIGIFLVVIGIANWGKLRQWSELSKKEQRFNMIFSGMALLILILALLYLRLN